MVRRIQSFFMRKLLSDNVLITSLCCMMSRAILVLIQIALDYFVQLFSTSIEAGFHNFSSFPSSMRTVHNASLLAPFTEGEFKTSMEMHPDKSSGPNGLNLAFYQQCWPIVGSDVFA